MMRNVLSILINREPVGCGFNAELFGNCSDVVECVQIVLGWKCAEMELRDPVCVSWNRSVFPSDGPLGTTIIETG
jgi:hypothetical protein